MRDKKFGSIFSYMVFTVIPMMEPLSYILFKMCFEVIDMPAPH